MKSIRRVLLIVLGVLIMGTGIFLLLATVHPLGGTGLYLMHRYGQTVLLLVGGALTVIGLILLLMGIFPSKKQPETVLQTGDLGEVRITLNALENMVLRVVQQKKEIRGSKRKVVSTPRGLVVYLQVKVAADQNLPELSSELQRDVKNYLEEITGIVVSEVKVNIENIILEQVPLKVK
ncbi:MAG: alkaline shock response membrane anchor protein AmaP [Dethiobacteria bacterium]|jgi:uncharacterized alkaline shock family protein YloU|nr:alkaline shock response membrane anchor protein AmaP [Bacillota bacterium]NMD33695.1 alkaline shock response membrane anchor protein AmaP [Bacillota bacterium]HOB28345.1 alkaline shock response membrane anchor protein AmaP [Bacillota bacterium]HPZ41277.1 alkaline shock response membrane anchor protein AmaP [Bacillota bacterium]HQD51894.1 alkaline shock response membrane anchor protein AmaP [Bacillota bacterium]